MTVLVGVLCQDGVVVGSDSAMTFAAGGTFRTVEQPADKTFVVSPDVLFAGTSAWVRSEALALARQLLRTEPGAHDGRQPPLPPG